MLPHFFFFGVQQKKYRTFSSLHQNQKLMSPFKMYTYVYLAFSYLNTKSFCFLITFNNIKNIYKMECYLEEKQVHLVISSCAVFSWHKSPYRFHSSAGTISCPDRGSSLGSHDSTPSTGPPCICRSEQLGRGERQQISIHR